MAPPSSPRAGVDGSVPGGAHLAVAARSVPRVPVEAALTLTHRVVRRVARLRLHRSATSVEL